jgi:hypothetical protein
MHSWSDVNCNSSVIPPISTANVVQCMLHWMQRDRGCCSTQLRYPHPPPFLPNTIRYIINVWEINGKL